MKEWQQKCFPQHTLSRLLGWLASAHMGALTHFSIKQFVKAYKVNLSEAKITRPEGFASFNDFFTRELRAGARTIVQDENCLISPVDGAVSELGRISNGQLIQAKGSFFSVKDLCGGSQALATCFDQGAFLTAYLSPKDYHRYHMPLAGKLLEMIYVPGNLFSVNKSSVQHVPGLFARNERVICIFETAIGKVAMIAVGAMVVGSIEMNFHGVVAPMMPRKITRWTYEDQNISFEQGEELGCFKLGSTIILLTEKNAVNWLSHFSADSVLTMGVKIGEIGES